MKAGVHPKYEVKNVECACGEKFETGTTYSREAVLKVAVCSKCHPFYTGAQGRAKKTGSIEKFNRKYGIKEEK